MKREESPDLLQSASQIHLRDRGCVLPLTPPPATSHFLTNRETVKSVGTATGKHNYVCTQA